MPLYSARFGFDPLIGHEAVSELADGRDPLGLVWRRAALKYLRQRPPLPRPVNSASRLTLS
jgi:hypothetical protein